jgi:hypothetical protein
MTTYTDLFDSFENLIKKELVVSQRARVRSKIIEDIIAEPFVEKIADMKMEIVKDDQSESSGAGNTKTVIVPAQLTAQSTLMPYYGIIALALSNGGITGLNLTPMFSGNIKQEQGTRDTFQYLLDDPYRNNVCTGSFNSLAPRGWRTLSRVNIDSMFSGGIIDANEVFIFADNSKKLASLLWKGIEEESLKEMEEIDV